MSSIPPIRHVKNWFYRIDETNQGPVDQDAFDELVASGVISDETFVWHQGWDHWRAYGTVMAQGSYHPEVEVVEERFEEEQSGARVVFSSTQTIHRHASSGPERLPSSYKTSSTVFTKRTKSSNPIRLIFTLAIIFLIFAVGVTIWVKTSSHNKGLSRVNRFEAACKSGSTNGCFNAGLMYERGDGIRANKEMAALWYSMGCDSGDAVCCYHLGLAKQKKVVWDPSSPQFRPVDVQRVLKLFKEGCQRGYPPSCTRKKELERTIQAN